MSKLRIMDGGAVAFQCPGCGDSHIVHVGEGPGPRWGYNGCSDRPTFTPSVLVRSGHHVPGFKNGNACWCTHNAELEAEGEQPAPFKCGVCHSFVTDGRIQFLNDCTHDLAGQTVDLPDFAREPS